MKIITFLLIIIISTSARSQTSLLYQHFTPQLKEKLVKQLTPEQRRITQNNGTEDRGSGQYYNFFEPGIYVDIVSGEPLFSSRDKYQAESGWPAFTKPIVANAVKVIKTRAWYGGIRHEVSSAIANSHLGDVFIDRYITHPPNTGKKLPNNTDTPQPRYCVDSAALRFIPLADMKQKGYGQYIKYVIRQHPYKEAIFAGGCFWCLESDFDYFKKHFILSHGGVINVVSGYAGGKVNSPTYELVSSGTTHYKESIQVTYDPSKITYKALAQYFYRRVNPTDAGGQFCDRGEQYQSAIYYTDPQQEKIARQITKDLEQVLSSKKNLPIHTQLLPNTRFYPAEKYHQNYHDKNPIRYCYYRTSCGRDKTVSKVWKNVNWPYSEVVPFHVPSNRLLCGTR